MQHNLTSIVGIMAHIKRIDVDTRYINYVGNSRSVHNVRDISANACANECHFPIRENVTHYCVDMNGRILVRIPNVEGI